MGAVTLHRTAGDGESAGEAEDALGDDRDHVGGRQCVLGDSRLTSMAVM